MTGYPGGKTTYQCRHCGTHSSSDVIAEETFYVVEQNDDGSSSVIEDYRYRLVRCTACGDLSLLMAMEIAPDIYDSDVSVYPANPRSVSAAVPKLLRDNFTEARTCYQAKAYTASAIMCRRTLESLALDRGIKDNTLAKALRSLLDAQLIDQRLYDWADALRLAGNDAVHDVSNSISQLDAKDMNDLTEAIIDYVYVFQARYEAFKQRRDSRSKP